MKSNAECLTLRLVGLVIVTSLLNACATGGFESAVGVCPPVVEYNAAEQEQAANEVEALPEGAILIDWLADYSVLRELVRICGA